MATFAFTLLRLATRLLVARGWCAWCAGRGSVERPAERCSIPLCFACVLCVCVALALALSLPERVGACVGAALPPRGSARLRKLSKPAMS